MNVSILGNESKSKFNQITSHIIQSWEWGEFRQQEGKKIVRLGKFNRNHLTSAYQLTFHQIPFFNSTIGYLPKSDLPNRIILNNLIKIGKENKAAFIKIEPDIERKQIDSKLGQEFATHPSIYKSAKTIFAPNTFHIDLTQSEDKLLSNMHHKTRYNIKLAKKYSVKVEEKKDSNSFETFLRLQKETAKRQKFFIHPDNYYRMLFSILKPAKMIHLLFASYKNKPVVVWVLFRFKDTIYYPYGGSLEEYKQVMASNLIAWEAIRLGKKLGCRVFDFWGALPPGASTNDPWYGFHRFKAGYGGRLVSYIGTYDLVIDKKQYFLFTTLDKLRWTMLRLSKFFS